MRVSTSLILGLLVGQGLCQTAAPEEEPTFIAPPAQTDVPAAEDPSVSVADPVPQTDEAPEATTNPDDEESAAPEETVVATDVATDAPEEDPTSVEDAEPTATGTDDASEPTTAAEETGTAKATATDDDATSVPEETATATDEESETGATATTSSAPTSTAAVVEVDLKNATVGDNAELVEVDGKTAVRLSAPEDGEATFTVSVDASDDFDTGEMIHIVASILVGEASSAKLRRRAMKTGCNLLMQVNGENVYDESLSTTDGKFQEFDSSPIESSPNPEVKVTQKCGKNPSTLTINSVQIANESSVGSGSKSGGSGSGSGGSSSDGKDGKSSDSGSGSKTGDEAKASETGDPNAGSKTATSIVGLVAAMVAVVALM
ncbi:hypothetical protein FALBO_6986 [Fusarium albosuccineum]|uniref:Uncharacterized protein n=1 Tax=Fusarium albosuccineum TaxID=1237068 RepID=A0A8H4LDJ9_9HYPO|nr:hypothetical protein FALBO_6986 [Fusarium albosuccineum]